jgi:hemerythrin-like domain-containing protein
MDAIELLKQDHRKVKALFSEFESTKGRPVDQRRKTAEGIVRELMVHETIEEQVFYPAFKEAADKEGKELVAESKEEHHVVDLIIEELQGVELGAEDFEAKMKVLQENVEHHIDEEEKEMFPDAKKMLGEEKLQELGGVMAELKESLLREVKPKRGMEH